MSSRLNRRLVLSLLASVAFVPSLASAQVTIFSPFNLPGTSDDGVVKIGDGIAYADGPRKKLDVYAPTNPTGSSPVVMFIYGGAWKAGDRAEYEFVGRAFAAAGFVCVIADYRLYPEVKYPEFLDDNAQAMRWIEDNIGRFGGDTRRFFVSGHSAGAYNAVMLALDPSFRQEFQVTMPILAVAGISGPYDFYPFEYNEVRTVFGDAARPEGTQPINLATADAPPMLLLSGVTDPIVRVENTRNLALALKKQGVWVTERYYEGVGHLEPVIAIGRMWRWRLPVLADIVGFFEKFGAFPSGAPQVVIPPVVADADQQRLETVVEGLDGLFAPIN